MVTWLRELQRVAKVCTEANDCIREENPSEWWRRSQRGDWMLYYIWVAMISGERNSTVSQKEVNAIAQYLRCPQAAVRTYFGLRPFAWNSSLPVDSFLAVAELAHRIRKVWPDLPLVV